MKKLAIILALLMIPSFAFALDTIPDNDLNEVTGQAGVSILFNSITIVKSGSSVTGYGDNDGAGNTNWILIAKDTNTDATTHVGFHGYTPLMIDVMDVTTLTAAAGINPDTIGQAGIEIVLPDLIGNLL